MGGRLPMIRALFIVLLIATPLMKGLAQDIPLSFFQGRNIQRELGLIYDSADPDSSSLIYYRTKEIKLTDSIYFELMPFQLHSVFNSHHPIPFLNGSLTNTGGVRTQISSGLRSKIKFVTLQIAPEFNLGFHTDYEGFSQKNVPLFWGSQYNWWNRIDLPEHNEQRDNELLWGQSFLSFNWNGWTAKYSTENRHWGPGKYDGLILSNNARGFHHLYLGTDDFKESTIGAVNVQWLAGRLKSSGAVPSDTTVRDRGSNTYFSRNDNNRFITGIDLQYRPSILQNLTVGFSNIIQQYENSANALDRLGGVTSIFSVFEGSEDNVAKQQLQSFSLHLKLPNSNAEIYTEILKQNPTKRLSDFLINPEVNRAWLFGLSKYWPRSLVSGWQMDIELTQLQQSVDWSIENGPGIYTDASIRHGYTHQGESLGSSLIPGSNRQTLGLSYWKNASKYGFLFQRIANNNDLYYFHFAHNRDFRRYWVDLLIGGNALFNINERTSVNARINYIYTINYQWEHEQDPNQLYFTPGNDVQQIQSVISLLYNFN